MALAFVNVTDDLPPGAENGFKLTDSGETKIFFHWKDAESYGAVLAAIPDRLSEQGYESETDSIMGKVVDMYGAG